jgi:hypothetical protein
MTNARRGETVSRRTALAGLSAGGLGLAMTATSGRPVAAQDASPTALVGHAMVGSWQMLAGDALGAPSGDPTTATFSAEGTVILTGRPIRPALPGLPWTLTSFATGHGAWRAVDEQTVDFTVVHVRSDETGTYRGTTTVSGTITIDADGRSITGQETFTAVDQEGALLNAFPGEFVGSRIEVQPMAELGTPSAG